MPRTFYRIVHSIEPTLDDFMSQKALGIPMARPDPEVELIWDGISVYATEVQARRQARAKPWLGSYIAELAISESDPVTFRRSGTGRGHHTLWGDPTDLRSFVQRIIPASSALGGPDTASTTAGDPPVRPPLEPPIASVEELFQRPSVESGWSQHLAQRAVDLSSEEHMSHQHQAPPGSQIPAEDESG